MIEFRRDLRLTGSEQAYYRYVMTCRAVNATLLVREEAMSIDSESTAFTSPPSYVPTHKMPPSDRAGVFVLLTMNEKGRVKYTHCHSLSQNWLSQLVN